MTSTSTRTTETQPTTSNKKATVSNAATTEMSPDDPTTG